MPIEPSPPRLLLGIAIALCAYLFFIAASSLVWTLEGEIPVIETLFMQHLVSLIAIFPLAARKGLARLKTQVFPIHLLRDLFGLVSYYLYFLAIDFLDLVDATTLNYTAPFFVPVVWWIWVKEKVGAHVWWSIIVGFIGVAIILNPTKEIFQLGFVFGVFAGMTSAVALCAIRVLNLRKEPMSRTLFYFFSFGTLISFPFAWASWVSPAGEDWIRMIGVGLATAIGQILITIAYRYGTASYLSPLSYVTVIYAGFITFFLFDRPLSLRTLIGALLIIGGGTATYLLTKRPRSLTQTFQSPNFPDKPPL